MATRQKHHALTPQQIACANSYQGGEYSYVTRRKDWRKALNDIGDSLFTFLMVELSATEDCDGDDEALRRLATVMADISAVTDAISSAPTAASIREHHP